MYRFADPAMQYNLPSLKPTSLRPAGGWVRWREGGWVGRREGGWEYAQGEMSLQ
jgi:hypothetical protein